MTKNEGLKLNHLSLNPSPGHLQAKGKLLTFSFLMGKIGI